MGLCLSSCRRTFHQSDNERCYNKDQLTEDHIKVLSLDATIDRTPTLIDESSEVVLKYRTPHFRASAVIEFPSVKQLETWTVGWVQACTSMTFTNQYGNLGLSSWEIPQLSMWDNDNDNHQQFYNQNIVSDSDGRMYPWYGATTEVFRVSGPQRRPTTGLVTMNDNFYPSVTWDVPLSAAHIPRLTHISRDQCFNTWLLARNEHSGDIVVLRTVQWRMTLDIEVDCRQPRGRRARLVSQPIQPQPKVLGVNLPVPVEALEPPSANNAQMLVWRPRHGPPKVAIAPKHHVMKLSRPPPPVVCSEEGLVQPWTI